VVREPHRGAYDRETIDKILDEGYVCHVGFTADGQTYVIPRFSRAIATRFISTAPPLAACCATSVGNSCLRHVTLTDGFVLARSVFNHSMNYRSVVALGKATLVDAPKRAEALRAFTEKIISGRWNDARQPTEKN